MDEVAVALVTVVRCLDHHFYTYSLISLKTRISKLIHSTELVMSLAVPAVILRCCGKLFDFRQLITSRILRSIGLAGFPIVTMAVFAPGQTIPAADFGMHVNPGPTYPLRVHFGNFRVWDAGLTVQWQGLQVCNSTETNCQSSPQTYTSLKTLALDTLLTNLYAAGIKDGVLYTLNRTPAWATAAPGYSDWQSNKSYSKNIYIIPSVNNPGNYVFVALTSGTSSGAEPQPWNQTRNGIQSDGGITWQNIGTVGNGSSPTPCNYGGRTCLVPPDLNPDGSGANHIWDDWVVLIATYVNNKTYLQSHPHIKYWEPVNEWFVDDTVNFNHWGGGETNATFAQMLRMMEDTRCIITGAGTIHNSSSPGSSISCSTYLKSLKAAGIGTGSAIDTAALIVEPSNDPNAPSDMSLSQNLLYCNLNPTKDYGNATTCTWTPRDGSVANCDSSSCWGSAAVDVINYHFYNQESQPENTAAWVSHIKAFMSTADQAKPLINGEGGTGCAYPREARCPLRHIWNDDASRAGFIPRYYALDWSDGITGNGAGGNWWYAYSGSGTLCTRSEKLLPEGKAYNTTYSWLAGGTPAVPFCRNNLSGYPKTVYACSLSMTNGIHAQLVWDSQYGPGGNGRDANCSQSSNPTICGNTAYAVPSTYSGGWYDINNTLHSHQATVTIGAVPILLVAK